MSAAFIAQLPPQETPTEEDAAATIALLKEAFAQVDLSALRLAGERRDGDPSAGEPDADEDAPDAGRDERSAAG